MTKKHFTAIANILGKKLQAVSTWNNPEAHSLALAYIEDFIKYFESENPRFDKKRFVEYINKEYNTIIQF